MPIPAVAAKKYYGHQKKCGYLHKDRPYASFVLKNLMTHFNRGERLKRDLVLTRLGQSPIFFVENYPQTLTKEILNYGGVLGQLGFYSDDVLSGKQRLVEYGTIDFVVKTLGHFRGIDLTAPEEKLIRGSWDIAWFAHSGLDSSVVKQASELLAKDTLKEDEAEFLDKARALASENRQKRDSGEDYFNHLVRSLFINALEFNRKDFIEAPACLLHDVLEENPDWEIAIKSLGNARLLEIVKAVTKLPVSAEEFAGLSKEQRVAVYMHHILEQGMEDLSILMVKYADQMDNARTLHGIKDLGRRQRKAVEMIDVYAASAYLIFGARYISEELQKAGFDAYVGQDQAVKFKEKFFSKHPQLPELISFVFGKFQDNQPQNVAKRIDVRDEVIPGTNELKYLNFRGLFYNPKTIFELWSNCDRGQNQIDPMDVQSFQLMVETTIQTSMAEAYLDHVFIPLKDKRTNYVEAPRAWGYQALIFWNIVQGHGDTRFLIQTPRMYEFGRLGVFSSPSGKDQIREVWEAVLRDIRKHSNLSLAEFGRIIINSTHKINIISKHGDIYRFPPFATWLDVAIAMQELRCVAEWNRITDKPRAPKKDKDFPLRIKTVMVRPSGRARQGRQSVFALASDGDQVEFELSNKRKLNLSPLDKLVMPESVRFWKKFLKRLPHEEKIWFGVGAFDKAMMKYQISYQDLDHPLLKEFSEAVVFAIDLKNTSVKYKIKSMQDLMAFIGEGTLPIKDVAEWIVDEAARIIAVNKRQIEKGGQQPLELELVFDMPQLEEDQKQALKKVTSVFSSTGISKKLSRFMVGDFGSTTGGMVGAVHTYVYGNLQIFRALKALSSIKGVKIKKAIKTSGNKQDSIDISYFLDN